MEPQTEDVKSRAGGGPTTTTGWSMAERRLISRTDDSLPLPKRMEQQIASAFKTASCQQQTPADSIIMNAGSNATSTIKGITHQKSSPEMALQYRDIIITAARNIDKRIIHAQHNASCVRLTINAVPRVQYMRHGIEGEETIHEEFAPENEGSTIPTHERWVVNPHSIRERQKNG